MARVYISKKAKELTVLLRHDAKAKDTKYTCMLTNKDGTKAMDPIRGREKECGPCSLPVPVSDNIGRFLYAGFTYAGKPGLRTRLTFEICESVEGISTKIGGFDSSVTIPADGLDSYGVTYEICRKV